MSPLGLHLIVLFSMTNQLAGHVSCEYSYSYEPEVFPVALINISYIDAATSLPKFESGEIGRYGIGKLEGVSGLVVHVTSNNRTSHSACDPLDKESIPREPYIALIKQGHCRDYVKLRNVAEANATGAVIYSYFFDTRLFRIRHEEAFLPYVFISGQKGDEIAALLANGTKVMMNIEVSASGSFRYSNINRTSVLFVSISFIILMIISMAWLVFYYVQRFRYIIAKDVLSKRLCSAAKKALDKIPVKTMKPKDCDKEDDPECCAICIEPLKADEVIRILPCKHSFHKVCVDPWLLDKRSCPMCKLDILTYFGLTYSGSQESIIELDDSNHRSSDGNRRSSDSNRRGSSTMLSDIIHISTSRRNSSSQTMPLTHDRATSPCSFVCLLPNFEREENNPNIIEVSIESSPLPSVANADGNDVSNSDDGASHDVNLADDACDFEIILVDNDSDAVLADVKSG